MTRLITGPSRPARHARFAGSAVALLLLIAACGGPTVTVPGSTASAGASSATTSAVPGASGSSVAAGDRLATAFASMAAGYTFDSTITVTGKVATHATGRWVAGSSEFVIESGGIAITYRTIPPVAWVLKPGTDWVVVAGAVPGGDPLDALSKPLSSAITANGADGLSVVGRYAPGDLGLTASGSVPVSLLIAPDGSVTATYSVDTTGGTSTSVVILRPAVNPEPVVAPSPAANPS